MATQLNNWLSIDKTSGTGNAEITLTASSYEELVDRATSLKVQGISANAILNVRQNALVPQIEVEGDLVFPSYGGERTISIKSNIGWRIENGDWYNFSITQGSANVLTNITITVDSNGGDERRIEIPIYKNDSDIIIGYITLTQNNANLTVEVPTDVENCFYIEPTVTDGRVIDIQFANSLASADVEGVVESYIFYYEDGTWKMFRPATAWNEFPILKIQKRVYFKEFYKRNTYRKWYLKFNITGEVNVGGDLSTLLGDVENPYGYNTTNADYANFLFEGCPIVDASQLVLPTKMYDSAYSNMFQNCSKLIAAPKLPATTLATYCYTYMFGGCTSLTTAPELPATDLEHACYAHMFDNCSKLENAPLLPARILKDRCYVYMFFNCVKLSHIEMLGLVMGDGSLGNWVTGVNASGTFVKADNVILETGNNGIPEGWSITESVYSPTVEELKSSYLWVEFENEGGQVGDFYSGIVYSFDGINWIQRTRYPFYIDMGTNKIIYLGSTSSYLNENTGTHYSITFNGKAKMAGKLTKIGLRDKYTEVFRGNEGLTDASELILPTKLSEGCFENLFRGCTSLVNPPQLPSTVLANRCYSGMFYGCTSLTTAPELPATTLADGCYGSMFYGCTSLVNPPQLPATVLTNGCYSNMFDECFSLVAAPQLPATTLAENCYDGMFRDCKSLTTAPILPATTLVPYCYSSMFVRCKNLETAPDLLAYTVPERAYDFMFNECTKLNYIKMLGVDISRTGLSSWVYGVQTTEGTFVKHPDAKLSTGESGIPKNWTVETATS